MALLTARLNILTSVVTLRTAENERTFWLVPLADPDSARQILESNGHVEDVAISPDGEWLAYEVLENGLEAIYLTRFPSGPGRWQIAANGAVDPVWTSTGKQLYFLQYPRIMAVSVITETNVTLGAPQEVLRLERQGLVSWGHFDITPNDERLVLVQRGTSSEPTIAVVENWVKEFSEKWKP